MAKLKIVDDSVDEDALEALAKDREAKFENLLRTTPDLDLQMDRSDVGLDQFEQDCTNDLASVLAEAELARKK